MREARPALVVAVRGPDEVEDAILGGAGGIETRDAARLASIREAAGGRAEILFRPAAPGEGEAGLADRIAIAVAAGEGLSRRPELATGSTPLTAVLLADEGLPDISPKDLATAGFSGVLVDLADETRGGLPARLGLPALRRLGDGCRAAGLGLAFAGALEAPDVPRLRALKPDALHFDRALRKDGRLDRSAVGEMAALLHAEPMPAGGPADRIFVRDRVVEMEVGAYGHERGRRQRVRFGVEVEVPRAAASAGMGGVYSYDLVTDAIAILAASAHVDFVETLAEDLAGTVLADPRVELVRIRVEKLDLGSGSVGIEIQRTR